MGLPGSSAVESAPPILPSDRDARLRGLGFGDPSEVEAVAALVSAFCGAHAEIRPGEGGSGGVWSVPRPGSTGRRLPDPEGGAWGLLVIDAVLDGPRREGVDRAAALLAARLHAGRAERERRKGSRGPEGTSFVPGLTHELRNAAFAFTANLDALEARHPEAAPHHQALRACLERLTGFVEELGAYGEPREALSERLLLPALLRDAAALCGPLAERRGSAAGVAWSGESGFVRGDAAALRGAFAGLFRFALAQGGAGEAILRAGAESGWARGEIDPPGLAAKEVDLARVFEPFHFKAAGTGRLALPLFRRVLEAHGGYCGAEAAPGGGLRIGFALPCA
jgi:signal transduction histidine kinase